MLWVRMCQQFCCNSSLTSSQVINPSKLNFTTSRAGNKVSIWEPLGWGNWVKSCGPYRTVSLSMGPENGWGYQSDWGTPGRLFHFCQFILLWSQLTLEKGVKRLRSKCLFISFDPLLSLIRFSCVKIHLSRAIFYEPQLIGGSRVFLPTQKLR